MRELGKPLKKARVSKEKTEKGWYRINQEDFPSHLTFSERYSYVSHSELKEAIRKFLEKNNINVKIIERQRRYQKKIYVYTDIEIKGLKIVFKIENSTDKTKAFRFKTLLLDESSEIPLVSTSFLDTLEYRKKHIGYIRIKELLKNMKKIINYINKNHDRISKYLDILKNKKISYEMFYKYLTSKTKDKKGKEKYNVPKSLQQRILGYIYYSNLWNWKNKNPEFITVYDLIKTLSSKMLIYAPASYDYLFTHLEKFLKVFIFAGV